MELPVHVPCSGCSFDYIADVLQKYLPYKFVKIRFSTGKLNISDAFFFLLHFSHHSDEDIIAWIDTTISPEAVPKVMDKGKWSVYTTSEWNKELIEKMGVHVKGIIPRPVDEDVAKKYVNSKKTLEFVSLGDDIEYQTAMVVKKTVFKREVTGEKYKKYMFRGGDKSYYDKKGMIDVENITRELGIRDKTRIVSNVPFADIRTHTLSEDDKYKLYASAKWYLALSRVEGFGMPPVEAMAVGTPSIHINGHAFKQWLVGIPIDVEDVYDVETPAGVLRTWNAKESDIKYAIKTAMEMSKEEYEDLRVMALERSREFYARRIIKMLGLPENL